MSEAVLVALTFPATALLLILVSVPMIRGQVHRNFFYGFRTRKTMSSDEVWYPANRFAGKAIAIAGVLQLVAGGGLVVFADELGVVKVAVYGTTVLVVSLAGGMVPTYRYLSTLPEVDSPKALDPPL